MVCRSIAAASIAVVAGCQVRSTQETETKEAVPAVKTAPAVRGPGARFVSGGDGTFDLSAYRGHVVLLDVWATWSPPCRAAVPDLNRLYEECSAQGLTMVGLAVDRAAPEEVAEAVKELGVIYPVALAAPADIRDIDGVRALPTRLLVDRKGAIRKRYAGAVSIDELKTDVLALLHEG